MCTCTSPLTDPRDGVDQRMLNIRIASYGNQIISSTTDLDGGCNQQLSDNHQKFDTHRRTKLTAPETISRSSKI